MIGCVPWALLALWETAVLAQALENKPFFRKGSTTAALKMRQQCLTGIRGQGRETANNIQDKTVMVGEFNLAY